MQHAMVEEFDKLPPEDKARIAALRTDAKSAGISDMEGALSVGALVSPNDLPIKNFHFEESYPDDKIHFDFKIRPGRCHTTNARYLLKMAGILS